jgi:hypothetical protein
LIFPLLAFGLVLAVRAAAPSAGTIGPAGPTLSWSGTAVGGSSAGEGTTCLEGINCDTFTLTVSGNPADYAGSVIAIKIQWTNPANDYDLYVHKDSNSGPVVAQGANGGAPGTSESTTIDPAATGIGIYTVHAVYFSVTPLVDEYQGTAQVQNKPQGRNANYLKTGISFSPNFMVRAPVASPDGQVRKPLCRRDPGRARRRGSLVLRPAARQPDIRPLHAPPNISRPAGLLHGNATDLCGSRRRR